MAAHDTVAMKTMMTTTFAHLENEGQETNRNSTKLFPQSSYDEEKRQKQNKTKLNKTKPQVPGMRTSRTPPSRDADFG